MSDNKETMQATFDTIYRGLAAQGFMRSVVEDEGALVCRYRGTEGKKCFVGQAIPEGLYHSSIEGLPFDDLRGELLHHLLALAPESFWYQGQDAHDASTTPERMQKRLARVAKDFGLTIPQL